MSKVDDICRHHQLEMLEDMKRRRDILNIGIANLEHAIDNPPPPISLDFEAIEREADEFWSIMKRSEEKRMGASFLKNHHEKSLKICTG